MHSLELTDYHCSCFMQKMKLSIIIKKLKEILWINVNGAFPGHNICCWYQLKSYHSYLEVSSTRLHSIQKHIEGRRVMFESFNSKIK